MCRARSSAVGAQRETHLRSTAPEAPSPPLNPARIPLRLPRRTPSQGTSARGHTQSGILLQDELQKKEGLLDSKALKGRMEQAAMVASLVLFIVTTVGARLVPDEVVNSRTDLVWYRTRTVREYSLTRSVLTHAQGLFSELANFCSSSQ